MIKSLFNSEGADYVADGYFAFNSASAALHEKLGFSPFHTAKAPFCGEEMTLVCCVLRRQAWQNREDV